MRFSQLIVLIAVFFTTCATSKPVLTNSLKSILAEFNSAFPKRSKSTDGWLGDAAHSRRKSGHNPDQSGSPEFNDNDGKDEVRAIDVTADLNAGSVTMETVVQHMLKQLRSGTYLPIRYIIFKGRIWSKTDGWKEQKYKGPNPHSHHVHISGDYGTKESTQQADDWNGKVGFASLTGGGGGAYTPAPTTTKPRTPSPTEPADDKPKPTPTTDKPYPPSPTEPADDDKPVPTPTTDNSNPPAPTEPADETPAPEPAPSKPAGGSGNDDDDGNGNGDHGKCERKPKERNLRSN